MSKKTSSSQIMAAHKANKTNQASQSPNSNNKTNKKERAARKMDTGEGLITGADEAGNEVRATDTSIWVPQRDKIGFSLNIREFPFTPKQKEIISLIRDKKTKIIFIEGPAGTSKTILAAYCGLMMLNEKRVSEIIYVRTVIESASKSLGFLPGDGSDKFMPYAQPLLDKLWELLPESDINKLLKDERIRPVPVNFLRGASWNVNYVILDEMQNFTRREIVTAISRIGKFSKFVCLGDRMQSDLHQASGLVPIIECFNDDESRAQGIHYVKLTKEDIMRSEILKFIVEKLEQADFEQAAMQNGSNISKMR
jgi:phosphate starvation-inducible protein PhoH